jgi:hypothetical protein
MVVGMPGTGLGGIVYLLLALFMPLRELARRAAGLPGRRRWRVAWSQAALSVAVIVTLLAEAWLIRALGS